MLTTEADRRLALRLFALGAAEREALLAQIDEGPRRKMHALLAEISELGITVDYEVSRQIHRLSTSGIDSAKSPFETDIQILDRVAPEWIEKVLKAEPLAVRVCVAAIHPWRWQSERGPETGPAFIRRGGNVRPTRNVQVALAKSLRQLAETSPGAFLVRPPEFWDYGWWLRLVRRRVSWRGNKP